MPLYEIQAPDGNTYQIEGPPGATKDQVRQQVLKKHPEAATAPKPKEKEEPPQGILDKAKGLLQGVAGYDVGVIKGGGEALYGIASTSGVPAALKTIANPSEAISNAAETVKGLPEKAAAFGSAPTPGPYGASPSAAGAFEKRIAPYSDQGGGARKIEEFKSASPFSKGEMIGEPVGAAVATAALPGGVEMFGAKGAARISAEEAAISHAAKSQRNFVEVESAQRRSAIKSELSRRIEEERKATLSENKETAASARKRLARLETDLAKHSKITAEQETAHHTAGTVSGLPRPYSVGTAPGSSTGERVEKAFEKAATEAEAKQKEAGKLWDVTNDVAQEKQKEGIFFESSAEGKKALKQLRFLSKGGLKEATPEMGRVQTADSVLSSTANNLYDALRGTTKIRTIQGHPTPVHYPVDWEVVRLNIRKLKEIAGATDEMGYLAHVRQTARNLADMVEKAAEQYVGPENYPREAYAQASIPINRFRLTPLGQRMVGRSEIPYLGKGESPHSTPSHAKASTVFDSPESVRFSQEMIGSDQTRELAEQHVADELASLGSGKDVKSWANSEKNAWIKEVPGLTEKVERYQQSLFKQEGNVAEAEASAKRIRREIDSYPKKVADGIKNLRAKSEVRKSQLRKTAEQQYSDLQTEILEREKIAGELEAFLGNVPSGKLPAEFSKMEKIVSQLPGTTTNQLAELRQAVEAASKEANEAVRKQKFRSAVKRAVLGGVSLATGYELYRHAG